LLTTSASWVKCCLGISQQVNNLRHLGYTWGVLCLGFRKRFSVPNDCITDSMRNRFLRVQDYSFAWIDYSWIFSMSTCPPSSHACPPTLILHQSAHPHYMSAHPVLFLPTHPHHVSAHPPSSVPACPPSSHVCLPTPQHTSAHQSALISQCWSYGDNMFQWQVMIMGQYICHFLTYCAWLTCNAHLVTRRFSLGCPSPWPPPIALPHPLARPSSCPCGPAHCAIMVAHPSFHHPCLLPHCVTLYLLY